MECTVDEQVLILFGVLGCFVLVLVKLHNTHAYLHTGMYQRKREKVCTHVFQTKNKKTKNTKTIKLSRVWQDPRHEGILGKLNILSDQISKNLTFTKTILREEWFLWYAYLNFLNLIIPILDECCDANMKDDDGTKESSSL